MKLYRHEQLVAEGSARSEPGGGIILFLVRAWHVRDADTDPWIRERRATWILDDGERRREFAGTTLLVSVFRDQVRTLTIRATTSTGARVALDVRDDPDA